MTSHTSTSVNNTELRDLAPQLPTVTESFSKVQNDNVTAPHAPTPGPHDHGPTNEPGMEAAPPTSDPPAASPSLPSSITWKLYTSHFLSTWNSRLFEFAAVLFLASIYPNTLQPMSIYALVRSAAAILFAQPLGGWIDTGNRLTIVRMSILGGRLAVAMSCAVFWVMEVRKEGGLDSRTTDGLFAVLVVLACVEKLCAVLNLVSVERDWVVAITEGNEGARRGEHATVLGRDTNG